MVYDIISDIYGCYDEMIVLIKNFGYMIKNGVFVYEEGRVFVFVGDLIDRGFKLIEVICFVLGVYEKGVVCYVLGNYCNKLYCYLKGNLVKVMYGFEIIVVEFEDFFKEERILVSE